MPLSDDDDAQDVGDHEGHDREAVDANLSTKRRLRPRGRLVSAIGAVLLLVAVAVSVWLAFEVIQAKSSLEAARDNVQQARQALLEGKPEDAAKTVDHARAEAMQARDATQSLPWNMVTVVPWLGSPFRTGQQISEVVEGLVADVLQPSIQIAQAISPDELLAEDGRIDVESLRRNEPKLSEIASAATQLDARAEVIAEPRYLSVMQDARTTLQAQVADLTSVLDNTALAARLIPSMTGADGPRSYFMGFQTNAEARGTGGLLGGFGILRFDDGRATVQTLGRNNELNKSFTSIDLGQEFASQYGFIEATTDHRNSNTSSHFPYAAQIWKSMWEQQSGGKVDGVISIDPVALSYILAAVGPVTMPDGETVSAENVVELTESTAYVRFAVDNNARKQYLQDVAGEVVKKMTGPIASSRQLLDALGKAAGERRIAVWSASPENQQILEETPLGHIVPDDPAPYAEVVINNLGGNKLDYYLERHIEYSAGACDYETRTSTVTVRLKSNVPMEQSLPEYVVGIDGLRGIPIDVPKGSNLSSIALLSTKSSKILGVYVNGARAQYFPGMERGHPISEVQLALIPGQPIEVKFELEEPTVPGAPRVPVQPLVDNVVPVVQVPECAE